MLRRIINDGIKEELKFAPKKEFYIKVGINRKRFGAILREQVSPNMEELIRVCEFFDLKLKNYLPCTDTND